MKDPEPVSPSILSLAVEQPLVSMTSPISQVGQVSPEEPEEKEDVSSEISVTEGMSGVSDVSDKYADTDVLDTPLENEEPHTISTTDEKFEQAWSTMFELLFREIATIYYPLKGVIPPIEQNIIQVKVKNEMMKDNFESRVRLALEYLRNNYDPRIDDIRVEVDANTESVAKVIYDTQDKMNDLRNENPDLPDFLKILNLSAKDI